MTNKIESIFSTRKIQERPPKTTQIIIDTREKQSLVAAHLVKQGAQIRFETLSVGDYSINDIVIERKTVSDFEQSISSGRIKEQLKNLKEAKRKCIILEETREASRSSLHKNARIGMLLAIALDYGISVLPSKNEEETARILASQARRELQTRSQGLLRLEKRPKSNQEQKRFILEGFPGIGPTIAKKLLAKYTTLQNIFSRSIEDLAKIDRFTESKIKKFKELLES